MKNNFQTIAEKNGEKLTLISLPLTVTGFNEFLCAWLLQGNNGTTLIDGGVRGSYTYLREALDSLGARPDLFLLTHIHLDHSGSAGNLVKDFPDIRIFCFERASKHLISPKKLWASTAATLGEDMAAAFQSPLPVPSQNIISRGNLPKGWSVIDTPGHASHHVSFIREFAGHKICFGGEALGVIAGAEAKSWFQDGIAKPVLRPATPPKYLPEIGRESMKKLKAQEWDLFCSAHFGSSSDKTLPDRALIQSELWEREIANDVNMGLDEDQIILRLLNKDPELKNMRSYTKEAREREIYFLHNSVRGFAQNVQ